jgi:small basic protein
MIIAVFILCIPFLIGVLGVTVAPKRFKPYVAFLGCAVTASMAAYFVAFCGREQSEVGLYALVIFGLGAVVLPLLLQREV